VAASTPVWLAVTAFNEAKLAPVPTRIGMMARPRLCAALNRLADRQLTLVTAPAGSGKSVLLASWLAERRDLLPAWVSLDANDDDPVRLWTYIAHAVERVRPGAAAGALATLDVPRSSLEAAIDQLLRGVATVPGRMVIVLDDLHHVQDRGGLRLLANAVEHLPANARIVAASRSTLGGRFSRLRAHRHVGELRAQELAFSVQETTQLLVRDGGLMIDHDAISLLVDRTEGWSAGIGLAGLWLADSESPEQEIQQLSGSHGHIAEYLTSEVLDGADERTRDFLLRTSVLERMSGPLCAAVLGIDDAPALLKRLERSNLFVVPLDSRGEWYRYHHLFRELLQSELDRSDPGLAAELHRRASAWFAEQDLIEEALEHLDAIGDRVAMREFLQARHRELLRGNRTATLLSWVARIPEDELARSPQLAAAGSMSAALLARPSALSHRLANIAEAGLRSLASDERDYVAAAVSLSRAFVPTKGLGAGLENARHALDIGRRQGNEMVVGALAVSGHLSYLDGDIDGAYRAIDEALARPEAPGRPHAFVCALSVRALLECDSGRPQAAEAQARLAVATAGQLGLYGAWSAGGAHHALGQCLLQLGQTSEAEHHLKRAEILRHAPEPRLDHTHTLIVLAAAHVASGRLMLAETELAGAREQLSAFDRAGRLPAWAATVESQLASSRDDGKQRIEAPSHAELAVLRLLPSDLSQREISEQLFLSVNTVKSHVKTIYRKLGAASREDAVRRAREAGLIDA
jgi:LuxR family maltose regulon positive regulatory protein